MNERYRTGRIYNLDLVQENNITPKWNMPIIKNENYIPKMLMGFNYAKSSKNKDNGIHFFLDDYQFERIWNYPEKYYEVLKEYDCILSPDFSMYLDMPLPLKIWNVYRSRLIGQYYQRRGLKVIATLSWGESDTFDFCFEGIPKGSVVCISTQSLYSSKERQKIFINGLDELIKRIEPSTILIYGKKLEYDFKNINVVYYENETIKSLQKRVNGV